MLHRVLEEDGAEDPVTIEGRTLDDSRSHLVDEREHLVVVARVRRLVDPVQLESLRRAAAALIQRGDEASPLPDLLELLLVHIREPTTARSTPLLPAPDDRRLRRRSMTG